MRSALLIPAVIVVTVFAVSACGQKGPLFIPAPAKQPAERNPADVPATSEQTK